jgi:flavin reductase (DIM6/NTAB) family NADH-FMN oxidoreductase RutF
MNAPASLDPRELRNALGRFATGVAVATARAAAGRPVGLTVNSVVAVSVEPPLVAWSLASRSGSLVAFLAAPYFALNILAEDQEAVSRRFAGAPVGDRFAGIA